MSMPILTPEQQIRQRYAWFEEAERVGNMSLACKRLGIARKTYYKWRSRFAEARGDRRALLDRSRRPHRPRHRFGRFPATSPLRICCHGMSKPLTIT